MHCGLAKTSKMKGQVILVELSIGANLQLSPGLQAQARARPSPKSNRSERASAVVVGYRADPKVSNFFLSNFDSQVLFLLLSSLFFSFRRN